MNTNTMELNMNEMEQVNGGSGVREALAQGIIETEMDIRSFADAWDEPISFAVASPFVMTGSYIKGFVKGLIRD